MTDARRRTGGAKGQIVGEIEEMPGPRKVAGHVAAGSQSSFNFPFSGEIVPPT